MGFWDFRGCDKSDVYTDEHHHKIIRAMRDSATNTEVFNKDFILSGDESLGYDEALLIRVLNPAYWLGLLILAIIQPVIQSGRKNRKDRRTE